MSRIQSSRRHAAIYFGVAVLFIILVVQVLYPSGKMLPFSTISDRKVGGQEKEQVIADLNTELKKQTVAIYFGDSTSAYRSPHPEDIGLKIDNTDRVEAHSYPWYMRLVPTSILWYGAMQGDHEPSYTRDTKTLDTYIKKELGSSCKVDPKNASLKLHDTKLEVDPSSPGGSCNISDVRQALEDIKPEIDTKSNVRIAMKKIPADVSDETAKKLAENLNERTIDGVIFEVKGSKQKVPGKTVLSWLDFSADGNNLNFAINQKRADDYFKKKITPKLTKAAGTTYITMRDFTEISRKDGTKGRTLDIDATIQNTILYLNGDTDEVGAVSKAVPPKNSYKYTYSSTSTGVSALMKHYAQTHKGVYGAVFYEVGGKGRFGAYNGGRSFITASTYKLFVAYGTLRRVDAGTWKWSDQINGGRNLSECFDDMIVKSDNACAETLLRKIGYTTLTNEIHAISLANSGFTGDHPRTTPEDLASFLVRLEQHQLPLSSSSHNRLIGAMKRNIYRAGIPSGTDAPVADKVGFLDALLHDASIVYSPKGTYVLVVMTDGSTWGNIADLTRQIENIR